MPNIPKWGKIDGNNLAPLYNLSSFFFINDFEAASYGLLIINKNHLVKLNGLNADSDKIRGVIGPGTGLGHSIILNNKFE
jgi:glucokinase